MSSMHPHDPVVLVVHDDPLVGFGVVAALERLAQPNLQVVQSAADEPAYGRLIRTARVIVTDYEQGMRLCEQLSPSRRLQGPHLMFVTNRSGEHDIRTAISLGVRGYLVNGFRIDELLAGVQALCRGRRYISNAAAARMVGSLTRVSLTPREVDVLRCLTDGCANKRIGQRLGISVGTVKSHVKNIFSKLGVSNRTEAAFMAVRLGILAHLSTPAMFEVADRSGGLPADGLASLATQSASVGRVAFLSRS